jgi:ubiquinone biosynthesis protein UbiJ
MSENTTPMTVSEMLRMTNEKTSSFMLQVADHLDTLEAEVARLQARVTDLERHTDDLK